MRIIAGKCKGKTLFSPKDESVRPTTDRIKENLFNIIQWRVPNCKFLDLFAGSGAIGIEAASRGAKRVVLVDNSKDSITLVKKNVAKACLGEEVEIRFADCIVAMSGLVGIKFDIVYCDPPYAAPLYEKVLETIANLNLLAENGIVIMERDADRKIELLAGWKIIDSRKYGKTVIDFLVLE